MQFSEELLKRFIDQEIEAHGFKKTRIEYLEKGFGNGVVYPVNTILFQEKIPNGEFWVFTEETVITLFAGYVSYNIETSGYKTHTMRDAPMLPSDNVTQKILAPATNFVTIRTAPIAGQLAIAFTAACYVTLKGIIVRGI